MRSAYKFCVAIKMTHGYLSEYVQRKANNERRDGGAKHRKSYDRDNVGEEVAFVEGVATFEDDWRQQD